MSGMKRLIDEAADAGCDAYRNNDSVNPYSLGVDQILWEAWIAGWTATELAVEEAAEYNAFATRNESGLSEC